MSLFLLSFEGDHHNLFKSREEAEQIASYYPGAKYTIRDLDQEARDREEMLDIIEDAHFCCMDNCGSLLADGTCSDKNTAEGECVLCRARALLERLGRLP